MSTEKASFLHYLDIGEFNSVVRRQLQTARAGQFALVSLDFDNFNYINDLFGYEMGNLTLRQLTAHFSSQLTDGECFSNIHADHFSFWVIADLTPSVAGRFFTMSNVDEVLTGILPAHYNLVCSGGIVLVDAPDEDLSILLDKSNFARKRAKGSHKNTFLYYDEKMNGDVAWRKIITLTMEPSLRDREFEMYLQPKVRIHTSEVVGAEALVRWNSKKYGMIYPDRFIPILEQNGFISQLDFFMLGEACRFLRECMDNGLPLLPISVNFSKVHLRNSNFVDTVFSITRRHGIPTGLIEIEFTENVFWEDFKTLVDVAGSLKRHGFKVSLDDFGSAYSSLNCLKDLPLDIIKIDKGFFDLSNTDRGKVIITKIVDLIKSLRLIPVMEGVETEEQSDFLQTLGCDLGQGYYYARPMPVKNYVDFLMQNPTLQWSPAPESAPAVSYENATSEELRRRITELEHAVDHYRDEQESLRLSEERYRIIVEQSNDIMFEWDFASDAIVFSEKYEKLLGRPPLRGQLSTSSAARTRIHPGDLASFEAWISNTFHKPNCVQSDFRMQAADGSYLWIRARSSPIFDRDGKPIKAVGVFSNIDQQKNEMAYLVKASQLDPLTRLYNKEQTRRRVESCLSESPDEPGAFFIIDVDNFKGVNDTLGHQLGDTVLVEVSRKIKKLFRGADVVGRIGGDEFAVFTRKFSNPDELSAIANELVHALRSSYFGATRQYAVSGSVGVALYPEHGTGFDALYRLSDVALYESKHAGKDRYTIYQAHMTGSLQDNHTPVDRSERFLTTYFENDFTYSVFEMLYETRDMHATIQTILELTGERFGVDRVYIFQNTPDGESTANTFEWCAEGIKPEMENLQNVSLFEMRHYLASYSEEGILCCSDLSKMDPYSRQILEPQGIQSFLHCAICDEGRMTGFIGFDMCREKREWHGDELATLGYLSRILSIFLLKGQAMQELIESNENYLEMLENLNGYVYVIDRQSRRLLYRNKRTSEFGFELGDHCFHAAFGLSEPCKDCPAMQLTADRPYAATEVYSQYLHGWVSSAASRLHWSGCEDAALICCTDISKYLKGRAPDA